MGSQKRAGTSARGGAGRGQGRPALLTEEQKDFVGEKYACYAGIELHNLALRSVLHDDEELERLETIANWPLSMRATVDTDPEWLEMQQARREYWREKGPLKPAGSWQSAVLAAVRKAVREEFGFDVSNSTIKRAWAQYAARFDFEIDPKARSLKAR